MHNFLYDWFSLSLAFGGGLRPETCLSSRCGGITVTETDSQGRSHPVFAPRGQSLFHQTRFGGIQLSVRPSLNGPPQLWELVSCQLWRRMNGRINQQRRLTAGSAEVTSQAYVWCVHLVHLDPTWYSSSWLAETPVCALPTPPGDHTQSRQCFATPWDSGRWITTTPESPFTEGSYTRTCGHTHMLIYGPSIASLVNVISWD